MQQIYTETLTLSDLNQKTFSGRFNDNAVFCLTIEKERCTFEISNGIYQVETHIDKPDPFGTWYIAGITDMAPDYELFVQAINRKPKDAFVYRKDGRLVLNRPESLSPDDWKKISAAFNKLGYDIGDRHDTKDILTNIARRTGRGYPLQKDQQEAIEKLFYDTSDKTDTTWLEKADEIERKAIIMFGTTPVHNLAGYITRHGHMLNFSHEGHQRDIDHREVDELFEDEEIENKPGSNTAALVKFMNLGNIRSSTNGIEISVPPTPAQRKVIIQKIKDMDDDLYVDFSSPTGSIVCGKHFDFPTDPNDVLQTIDLYFENGRIEKR